MKQLKGKVFIGAGFCRVAAGSTVRTKRARKQSRCMNEVWRRVDFNLSTCFGRRCFGRWTRILVLLALYGLGQGVVASAQSWVNLGPGAYYAKIIKVDPSTPSTLYAGFVWEYGDFPFGGVLKSTNSGQSWSNASTGLPTNLDIYALAIDPKTPTTLYTGGLYGGVYKSVNGGASWTATMSAQNNSVLALAIDPQTPTTIYAGFSNTGVYKSVDGAATWNLINMGLPGAPIVNALAIDPQTPTTIYAGLTSNGVYKSIDGGNSWSAVGTGLLSGGTVRALAINPVTPTTVYAATDVVFGNTSGQVFVSVDGGSTWNSVSNGLPIDAYGLHDVEIDPATPSTLYVAVFGDGVYKSTDSGNTWTAINTGLTSLFDHNVAIALTSPTTVYVASCTNGVFIMFGGSGPTLTASPTSVSSDSTVTATWAGIASPSSTDLIGLYQPNASNSEYIDWIYVSCSKSAGSPRASGSCPFVLPATLAAGTYQLRLLANSGFTVLVTSNNFTVTSGGSSPTLTASPTTISSGGTLTATWAGIASSSSTDWIGLYQPNASNSEYIDWIYVSCSQWAGSPRASGSCPFVLPATLAAATYQLRLLANDGFTVLATSNNFTVTH